MMYISDKAICDKYYYVHYRHDNYEGDVKGYLWNYNSGNIVIVSDKGVFHIKYKDILFMCPIKPFDIEGVEENKIK